MGKLCSHIHRSRLAITLRIMFRKQPKFVLAKRKAMELRSVLKLVQRLHHLWVLISTIGDKASKVKESVRGVNKYFFVLIFIF